MRWISSRNNPCFIGPEVTGKSPPSGTAKPRKQSIVEVEFQFFVIPGDIDGG
jgi:hypothetical protein